MSDFVKLKEEIDELSTYPSLGTLSQRLERKEGYLFLQEIESLRNSLKDVREEIVEDLKIRMKPYDLRIDPKKLWVGDCFQLINSNGDILLVSNKKEQIDVGLNNNKTSLQEINLILQNLFQIYHNSRTKNILSNEFYEDLYIVLNGTMQRLLLNGEGVTYPVIDLDKFKLSEDEKCLFLKYYFEHEKKLLEKVFVLNDQIVERFILKESKDKVLRKYRGDVG